MDFQLRTKKLFLLSIPIIFLSACGTNQTKFDKSKWSQVADGFYMYREAMVKDLMKNHLKKGMSYNKLVDLIGKPANYSNLEKNTIGYPVMVDFGWDIDPVETKTLVINLTSDSIVKNYKIVHWRK